MHDITKIKDLVLALYTVIIDHANRGNVQYLYVSQDTYIFYIWKLYYFNHVLWLIAETSSGSFLKAILLVPPH